MPREVLLCERLDECNYLEAGVSAMDCADSLSLCTMDLVSSQQADWSVEADSCLSRANCKNFYGCAGELPDCSPIQGDDTCVPGVAGCDYCWGGATCPAEYLGAADGCDCGCANGPDPDC